jgi:hypothetical protein
MIFVIQFGLEKICKKCPKFLEIFRGLGMILAMKTSLINKKKYIRVFSTLILRCLRKKKRFAKEFQILSST